MKTCGNTPFEQDIIHFLYFAGCVVLVIFIVAFIAIMIVWSRN